MHFKYSNLLHFKLRKIILVILTVLTCRNSKSIDFIHRTVLMTQLYLQWITNKVILYSTGNSAPCYVAAWMGGEFRGQWKHVYVWLSPSAVHLKLSQHCLSATLQYKE